jgi:sodium/potassium/calcium exchanger 6
VLSFTVVSIVVGSIALIRPFHVPRHAFLRDVLFFTAAVVVLITVLHDGHLTVYESGGMVLLYLAYVAVVVTGNWWGERKRRIEDEVEWKNVDDDGLCTPDRRDSGDGVTTSANLSPAATLLDLPSPAISDTNRLHRPASASSLRVSSPTGSPLLQHLGVTSSRPRNRSRSHTTTSHLQPSFGEDGSPRSPHVHAQALYRNDTPRAAFSLLGAVEFRDVVNSLRKESETRASSPVGRTSPRSGDRDDYFGPIEAFTHRKSSAQGVDMTPGEGNPFGRRRVGPSRSGSYGRMSGHQRASSARADYARMGHGSSETRHAVSAARLARPDEEEETLMDEPNPWEGQQGLSPFPTNSQESPKKPDKLRLRIPDLPPNPLSTSQSVPSISIVDPSGHTGAAPIPSPSPPRPSSPAAKQSRFQIRRRSKLVLRILFPSLQSFRHKSVIGMILAIMSVPAILVLTLTLPVVDDGRVEEGGIALPSGEDEPLDDGERVSTSRRQSYASQEGSEAESYGDRLLGADVGEELHHLVDGGFSPLHSPLGRIHHSASRRSMDNLEAGGAMDEEALEEAKEDEALEFHKVLTAVQCVLGPVLCCSVVFSKLLFGSRQTPMRWWLIRGQAEQAISSGYY